jgi:hypothetical protein
MIVSSGYTNTSGGYDCECKLCAHLSPMERETKGWALHEQRRAAGRARAAQPSAALARSKGFQSVMEKRPEVLLWLKRRIKSHNKHKAAQLGITTTQYKKRRVAELHEIYVAQGCANTRD